MMRAISWLKKGSDTSPSPKTAKSSAWSRSATCSAISRIGERSDPIRTLHASSSILNSLPSAPLTYDRTIRQGAVVPPVAVCHRVHHRSGGDGSGNPRQPAARSDVRQLALCLGRVDRGDPCGHEQRVCDGGMARRPPAGRGCRGRASAGLGWLDVPVGLGGAAGHVQSLRVDSGPSLGALRGRQPAAGAPAFGLSGALPALLRLSIADMGHLGRHTGGMIAVSTVGSLVGTWGTAFYLLTWLGSVTLVAALGGVQVTLGLLWWWRTAAVRSGAAAPAIGGLRLITVMAGGLGLILLGWLALHPIAVLPPPLYQEDSPYQQVRIRDDDLLRYLILDRTFHAVMWKVDPVELFLPYSQMMMAALGLHPDPARALILGHGGGSLAKWLARRWPGLGLDLVEVDPSVVRAAEQYFGYHTTNAHHVYVKDARVFLRMTDAGYD